MNIYILLLFEVFIIIFYGVFVRTGQTSVASVNNVQTILYFCLAFTLAHLRHRLYDWSMLTNLLFITAIGFQLNILYLMFWQSAIDQNYNGTTQINSYHLIVSMECILAVLVTSFEFIGKMNLQQIFALTMVEVFGFAFTFSMGQFGLRAITGGCTISVFLFAFLFMIPIRKLCFNQDKDLQIQGERYFTMTLRLIGLVMLIILWPSFTYYTALVDEYYLDTIYKAILSTNVLSTEGYLQMFLGLLSCIMATIGLRIYGQKLVLQKFIRTIINTAIFLSSPAVVIIDPVGSLLLGIIGPLVIFLLEKYGQKINKRQYAVDSIIMCVLSGIFSAIFTAGRNNRTPSLANQPLKQGGIQFAFMLVVAGLALVFGLVCGFILRCLKNPHQSSNNDNSLWLIDQQNLPIYPDDPFLKKLLEKDLQGSLKRENILFNLNQSFVAQKTKQNVELGKILKQQLDYQSRIR